MGLAIQMTKAYFDSKGLKYRAHDDGKALFVSFSGLKNKGTLEILIVFDDDDIIKLINDTSFLPLGNPSESSSYMLYLFRQINDLSKNDFKEKIKTSDLELKFSTNDKISTVKHLNYRLNIKYNSFNPKRDTKEALKIYKKLSSKIEIKDEYYQNDDSFDEILLEFTPSLYKNLFLDLSLFPFCIIITMKKR